MNLNFIINLFKNHDLYKVLTAFKDQYVLNLKCHEKNFYRTDFKEEDFMVEKLNLRMTGTVNYFNSAFYKFPQNIFFLKNL
jgi:hypothetical protein